MSPAFAIASALALGSAFSMVMQRNPVYSAVSLLVSFLSVAVIFLSLGAPFLASIHVIVYTGAILVLFVFVIMLLNLQEHEFGAEYPMPVRLGIAAVSFVMFAVLASAIYGDSTLAVAVTTPPHAENMDEFGSVTQVGRVLFEQYALQFELVSVLIIVAMFGAVILAKKKLPE